MALRRDVKAQLEKPMDDFIRALKEWAGHRKHTTLPALRRIDNDLTAQWVGVNIAKTGTAGLAVASAIFVFVFPPVGIGLGIGAAVTGVGTTIGDWITDQVHGASFKQVIDEDESKCKKMCLAAQVLQETLSRLAIFHTVNIDEILSNLAKDGSNHMWQRMGEVVKLFTGSVNEIGQAVVGILQVVKIVELSGEIAALGQGVNGVVRVTAAGAEVIAMGGNGAVAGTKIVASTGMKVLGSIGAAISVADAVHSWCSSKEVQLEVRTTISSTEEQLSKIRAHLEDDKAN
eukprot:TRINITY_DN75862_c0_g1_i1.p1 TRINITY_DN75862_c0_g1~~TRINITY_DN75862_c0_g1_i1.p1  ORF type:complete len:308 (+),score=61.89 TRINITY_DN75862_c0_g1_i1:63-926(+)